MPAYNFKGQFAELVEQGVKPHTIRPRRKRPTRVGETLYLYTGMRTRACRKLRIAACTRIRPIEIRTKKEWLTVRLDGQLLSQADIGALARRDGFECAEAFSCFFLETYGPKFKGELIEWQP